MYPHGLLAHSLLTKGVVGVLTTTKRDELACNRSFTTGGQRGVPRTEKFVAHFKAQSVLMSVPPKIATGAF